MFPNNHLNTITFSFAYFRVFFKLLDSFIKISLTDAFLMMPFYDAFLKLILGQETHKKVYKCIAQLSSVLVLLVFILSLSEIYSFSFQNMHIIAIYIHSFLAQFRALIFIPKNALCCNKSCWKSVYVSETPSISETVLFFSLFRIRRSRNQSVL